MNKTLKRLLIMLLIAAVFLPSSGCLAYRTGSSNDIVYGIDEGGWIWDTYKIYLKYDQGVAGDSTATGVYTVDPANSEVIKKLKAAEASGEKVKIIYQEHLWGEFWKYDGNTVIIDVQPAGTGS
jgi:hypothetical protein